MSDVGRLGMATEYVSYFADSLTSLPVGLANLLVPKTGGAALSGDASEKVVPQPKSPVKKTRPSNSMLVLFVALLVGGTPLGIQNEKQAPSTGSVCVRRARRVGRTRVGGWRARSHRRRSLMTSAVSEPDGDEDEDDVLAMLQVVHRDGVKVLDPEMQKWVRRLRNLELKSKPVQVRIETPQYVVKLAVPRVLLSVGASVLGRRMMMIADGAADEEGADGEEGAKIEVVDENAEEQEQEQLAAEEQEPQLEAEEAALLADARDPASEITSIGGDSTGGVYRVTDAQGATVAVWKPEEEEDLHRSEEERAGGPLREGLAEGDGAVREVAAYVLDRASGGAAGVPPTVRTSVGGQTGSLQRFVAHQCSADDMGTGKFEAENVHKVGLLDLRLFNLDRHGGNLLVDEEDKLVPIDHGLCLPPLDCLAEAEFAWLYWRQARQPFSASTKEWVAALDAEADAERLRALGLPESSVATSRVCTTVLQRCVAAGLTLNEIGSLFVRRGLGEEPSALEKIVAAATKDAAAEEQPELIQRVSAALDAVLAQRQ